MYWRRLAAYCKLTPQHKLTTRDQKYQLPIKKQEETMLLHWQNWHCGVNNTKLLNRLEKGKEDIVKMKLSYSTVVYNAFLTRITRGRGRGWGWLLLLRISAPTAVSDYIRKIKLGFGCLALTKNRQTVLKRKTRSCLHCL